MSNKLSEAPTAQDIEDLEAIVSCVKAITWEFDNLTDSLRMENAVLSEKLRHSSSRSPSTAAAPAKTPQGLNPILAQEITDASAAYAQELTRWAQELEKRNRQNIAETDPITSGGTYRLPEETFKPVPMPMVTDSAIVAGTIVGAAADAVADTFLVFVSLAGPINAPYNPVDAKFGYKEAFWKMLGYDEPPIGARTEAENEQLGEALENAMFALYGQNALPMSLDEFHGQNIYVLGHGDLTEDGYFVRINVGDRTWPLQNYVTFEGIEVRAVRDLSHIDDATLEKMRKDGTAAKTIYGDPIVLHHLDQDPNGPLVEIPDPNHSVWNEIQHPSGNQPGAGLSDSERAEYEAWKRQYWKWRAMQEQTRRQIMGD